MPKAIAFATIGPARTARTRIDDHLGFPRAGINAGTGLPSPVGGPGWTITFCNIVRVVDTAGLFFPAGSTRFLVGPIPDALADALLALPSPPTVVDVPAALWRKGRHFRTVIAGWDQTGPVGADEIVDFDEDERGGVSALRVSR